MEKLNSFLYRAYAYTFLNNLILIYPLYSIMFQDAGLTTAQIGAGFMFWSVATILCQLPIGLLSDRTSRRDMLMLGNGIVALAFFIFMAFPTFAGVMVGFGLWGVKWAIDAVCFQPMVYDRVRSKEKYLAIVGTCGAVALAGTSLSALASFLAGLGYEFLTWCTIGITGVGALVLAGMPRDCYKCRRNVGRRMRLGDLAAAAKFVFMRPALLGTMGILAIVDGAWGIEDFLGLIALQLGYPDYAVGSLYFIAMMCGVVGGFAVRSVHNVRGLKLPMILALAGSALAIASMWYNVAMTFVLGVFWLLLAMGKNIAYADFQSSVSTEVRGRATAILEIMLELGAICVYGILTASEMFTGEFKIGLYVTGALLVITSLALFIRNRK